MTQTIYDLVIVGGGASGMMAAAVASENGASVALIEKNNRLGEKLRISGGGRCNITNAEFDLRALLKNYGKAEQFLYSAFTEFGVKDTIDYFTDLGLPIMVEARKRAFPVSEKADDVVHAMTHVLHKNNVDIIANTLVTKINHSKSTIFSITCGNRTIKGKSYILASGGTSRPETGATGAQCQITDA
jgi:predicted Rossmann fold flavoprotein